MNKSAIAVLRLGFSVVLAAVLSQAGLAQSGQSTHQIFSGGAQRAYLLYLPPSYRGEPVPLVFSFHGSGGVPQNQVDTSGFNALADEHGFAAVYPAGAFTNTLTARSWNANAEAGVDDVQFVRDMIEDIARRVSIDRQRIYVSGFSGGARISSLLACELSDVLAAAAPVAGLQYPEGCMQKRPISILTFHGKADESNHYQLREDSRPYWRMGVETAIDKWRQANGCSLDNDTSYLTQTVTYHSWTRCQDNVEMAFYVIEDGGHTWPGSAQMATGGLGGVTNMEINASELIWEFFSRHSLAE